MMNNSDIYLSKSHFTRQEVSDQLTKLDQELRLEEHIFQGILNPKINECYVKNVNNNNSLEQLEIHGGKVMKLYPDIHFHFHHCSLLVGHEIKSILFQNNIPKENFFKSFRSKNSIEYIVQFMLKNMVSTKDDDTDFTTYIDGKAFKNKHKENFKIYVYNKINEYSELILHHSKDWISMLQHMVQSFRNHGLLFYNDLNIASRTVDSGVVKLDMGDCLYVKYKNEKKQLETSTSSITNWQLSKKKHDNLLPELCNIHNLDKAKKNKEKNLVRKENDNSNNHKKKDVVEIVKGKNKNDSDQESTFQQNDDYTNNEDYNNNIDNVNNDNNNNNEANNNNVESNNEDNNNIIDNVNNDNTNNNEANNNNLESNNDDVRNNDVDNNNNDDDDDDDDDDDNDNENDDSDEKKTKKKKKKIINNNTDIVNVIDEITDKEICLPAVVPELVLTTQLQLTTDNVSKVNKEIEIDNINVTMRMRCFMKKCGNDWYDMCNSCVPIVHTMNEDQTPSKPMFCLDHMEHRTHHKIDNLKSPTISFYVPRGCVSSSVISSTVADSLNKDYYYDNVNNNNMDVLNIMDVNKPPLDVDDTITSKVNNNKEVVNMETVQTSSDVDNNAVTSNINNIDMEIGQPSNDNYDNINVDFHTVSVNDKRDMYFVKRTINDKFDRILTFTFIDPNQRNEDIIYQFLTKINSAIVTIANNDEKMEMLFRELHNIKEYVQKDRNAININYFDFLLEICK